MSSYQSTLKCNRTQLVNRLVNSALSVWSTTDIWTSGRTDLIGRCMVYKKSAQTKIKSGRENSTLNIKIKNHHIFLCCVCVITISKWSDNVILILPPSSRGLLITGYYYILCKRICRSLSHCTFSIHRY